MPVTALSLGILATPALVLSTADQMTTNVGGTGGTSPTTKVGRSTGFSQIPTAGTTAAWASSLQLQTPNGLGAVFDSTSLEGNQLVGGTWSQNVLLSVSAGSLTADLYARVYLYSGGVYVLLGTLTLPGQTIPTTPTLFTLSGTIPPSSVSTGQKLYLDLWANVSANNTFDPTATIAWGDLQSTAPASTNATLTTQGFQPLSQAAQASQYKYGNFVLHDGVNYLMQTKDFDLPEVQETFYKIARLEGMKKTGETVNQRTIPISLIILGTSRLDVETKLDALYQALSIRQQQLTLHALDGRYWWADAVKGSAKFVPGKIVAVQVSVSFVCAQPYAFSPGLSSFTYPSTLLTNVTGTTWAIAVQSIVGGGTVFSRPTITLTNNTPTNNNLLAEPASPAVNTTVSANTAANATSITVASNTGLTGAGTIVLDVSPGTANQEAATFSLPATGGGPYTLTVAGSYNGGHLKNAHTSADVIRSCAFTNGQTGITSIPIASPGLASAVTSGQVFLLSWTDPVLGAQSQVVTASAGAAQNATALPVTSFTANANYPAGGTAVNLDTRVTALTLTQANDGQSFSLSGIAGFTAGNYLLITCDPLGANGFTALLNGVGTPLAFTGVFPVQEPVATSWGLSVTCNNAPTLSSLWQWTARWAT